MTPNTIHIRTPRDLAGLPSCTVEFKKFVNHVQVGKQFGSFLGIMKAGLHVVGAVAIQLVNDSNSCRLFFESEEAAVLAKLSL
jgi:hypothetical protein